MPKKKGLSKINSEDFTVNDCANAPKPVTRLKKSVSLAAPAEQSWDEIGDDFDIVEEVSADGTKSFVYKKKKNTPKCIDNIDDRPGNIYPEILFYLIGAYIKPEQIATFACINKASYVVTKRESFWRNLYQEYCHNNPRLPERLRLETSYPQYGLRQRVIRGLHHTYDPFVWKLGQEALQDSKPHSLVGRRCVNVWYCKGPGYWLVFFKFKKVPLVRPEVNMGNMIEELTKIDANPEENCQVLQVTCQDFYELPPLMGLTLTSVSVVLSQGFRHHRLQLGFNSSSYNISRSILPEHSVVIDRVVNMFVLDWWHPKYQHFDNSLPTRGVEEAVTLLKRDFFSFKEDL